METKRIDLNSIGYTQLTVTSDFAILNTDAEYIRMVVADVQPAVDTQDFMVIRNNCGLTSNNIIGTVWGRSGISGSSFVMVTE